MKEQFDRFLTRLKQQADALHHQSADLQSPQSLPNCSQNQYFSVDREGEVFCLKKQHHSHEVGLDQAESDRPKPAVPPDAQSSQPIKPPSPRRKHHQTPQVWQVSYELVQFIYSENVSNHTIAND
jgi:hypothetical protein